jgi:signal transduction histidine kinase
MLRPAPHRLRLLLLFVACGCALPAAEPAAPLTSAAAVRSLSATEAAAARAVRLRGQLVLATATGNALVLLDRGEGIYVALPRAAERGFRLGDEIEVVGVSDAGDFAPIVRAQQATRLGSGALPAPRAATVAEIAAGGLDAAWIELRGIVRACTPLPPPRPAAGPPPARGSWLLSLAQGDDRMNVQVNGHVSPAELVDAHVRLRAVVFNVHNTHRQFVRAYVQVPEASLIETVVAPPADPFARPVQRIADVLRFSRDGFSGHRVHVRGVVTGHRDGQTLWIREGEHGLRIASAQTGALQPGDAVDVAGFPDHGSYTPSLSDAVFRRTGSGPAPAPRVLAHPEEIARHDANLVAIDATLREARISGDTLVLVLDWQQREVLARALWTPGDGDIARWAPGSGLRVAGLCVAGQADIARPTGLWRAEDLQLWLRSPGDVAVRQPAPWLTPRRAVALFVTLALAALTALVLVALAARRKLAQREEARKMAEVEFSAMLAERNRLARDIHDTLAQDLNAVSMQLELAKNAARAGGAEPVTAHLGAAHGIVRKCLAEARESIWNMRSHILEQHSLPEALRRVSAQLAAGATCTVRTATHGELRRLAPAIENNLLRIGQEAVSNALRHARARTIDLALHYEPARVRLVVRDDGRGFDPDKVSPTGSHFGVRGMRERVAQMQGRLTLAAAEGGGTQLEVTVEAPG